MSKLLTGILLCFIAFNSIGQVDNDEMHKRFLQYLEMEKVDSIYNSYLEIDENNEAYEQALLYRNQYGWALNKIEQLKNDIPAILKLPNHSHEMAYERIFRPQKFPPTEWNRFYEISLELEKSFEINSVEFREILGIKTKLEFITRNDNALLIDLPKLLELLNSDSNAYSAMLWQYGNLLIRNDEDTKAQKVFEKGLKLNLDGDFLKSLIRIYSDNKEFEKLISYEEQILSDSSGVLLFNLAEAYLKSDEINKAEKYFNLFISKIEYVDYEPYVKIEYDNTVYHVSPSQLEILGNFYFERDNQLSCKFYENAAKIISNSNEERFFKKQLMAVNDKAQKKRMTEQFEKHKREQQNLLVRINKKIEKCK